MPESLTIIAGQSARKKLLETGFRQQDYSTIVAASGGPKWFILFGLDKYLFSEFFASRKTPINTLGSSAGAWQLSCFAQPNPSRAVSTLATLYSSETYSEKPSANEISNKAERLLKNLFGEHGITHLVSHSIVNTHILANRSKGLCASERKGTQFLGLGLAAAGNLFSRKLLRHSFTRVIFHASQESYFRFTDQPTQYVQLTAENGAKALMASGSIPLVLRGVQNIPDAPEGVYRDGGIIDYQFDLPFSKEGLVLYPHFSQRVVPGWFDKKLSYRKANPAFYDNVVLLTPSRELVTSLPYGKISDRNDFLRLEATTRKKYWKTVLDESSRMADDFHELVEKGLTPDQIKCFPATE